MVTIFGTVHQAGGCGPEALGAIELLNRFGIPVRCILPIDDPILEPGNYATDFLRNRELVELVHYEPGMFSKQNILVSFGEGLAFKYMSDYEDRPKWSLFTSGMTFPVGDGMRAFKEGLVDEFFFQSPRFSKANAQAVWAKTGKTPYYRTNYLPYINPSSSFSLLNFSKRDDDGDFRVLRISRDDPEKYHSDTWRMFSAISPPAHRKAMLDVVGWGPNAEAKIGNPCQEGNRWNKQLNLKLHPHLYTPEETAPFYNNAHVLLHYYPVVESFGFATVQAMAAGAVVIGAPEGGFADLISHGKTGLHAASPEEASYLASKLAWEPEWRDAIATNAYNWLSREGPGNPDLCWPWWKKLLEDRGGN
jgi:glycosyltransferase involved in cell wall biosynthesis